MGFAVLHLDKAAGSDSAMSSHIERTIHPANADEKRTHLNRELIEFPTGVESRTQAIQHRLDTAGITRKIGRNQVRAIRVLLSGSPDAMKRIEQTGQLDAWCRDNLDWLQCTFGHENVVSAVLHMDETTPHIHATVVPIVRGERRKAAQQQTKNSSKRTYRKKKDAPRLCADDIMSRPKLKEYQTAYAECMAGYGLQRGINGSEAKHITCSQFYKEVFLQQSAIAEKVENMKEQRETLSVDIAALQARQTEAQTGYNVADEKRRSKEQELAQVKRELSKTQVKQKAASATESVLDGIVSLFDDSKQKKALREIETLKQENAGLRNEIDKMQAEYAKERDELKQDAAAAWYKVDHICELFPQVGGLMKWVDYCQTMGLTPEWIKALFTLQPYKFTGRLTSPQFHTSFRANDVTLQFCPDKGSPERFSLLIDGIQSYVWFQKQRNHEIKLMTGIDMERQPKIKIDRGIH